MTDPSEPTPETPGGQPVSAGAQAPSNTAPYIPGTFPPSSTASDAGPAASTSAPASSGPGPAALAADRPELAVGAAFAGGFLFAIVLKRLAR